MGPPASRGARLVVLKPLSWPPASFLLPAHLDLIDT